MECCSRSFGVSRVVGSRNEVVGRKMWRKSTIVETMSFRNVVKELAFPVLLRNSRCRRGSQSLVVVVELSEPPGSLQSRVAVTREGGDSDSSCVGGKGVEVLESRYEARANGGENTGDVLGGSDGNGSFTNGRGGGGGGGGGGDGDQNWDDKEENEFGPILKFEEVMKETEARGASLPLDMLEAAKSVGIRKVLLLRYLDLQESVWPLGFAMKSCSMLRNRMLADPSFLFKVGTEIVIDSCCATFAEVQKRGKDFWAEFELYVADLLVGVVVNVALVGMLAPYARIGVPSLSNGLLGRMQHAYGALPSSVFEAERPGCRFTIKQRIGTYFYKGILYGAVGFACGIIGQGIANLIMTAKRSVRKSEDDIPVPPLLKSAALWGKWWHIPVPPLLKSAALWGVFLAVSSNTRYQIINGLERLVEASAFAKQVPPAAMAFTVGVRFANNVYGGMQFVDWARWSGVQ